LNEFKTGFAFLARSTGAPVLSVGLDGIYKFGHRTHVVVAEPEKIERVKGIPSSKHLAERSEYFRQKVWGLKQRALGVADVPVLPVAAETPEEVVE
jgi:1-acyl-sn-glycerol-3-phosphate acyltransferase